MQDKSTPNTTEDTVRALHTVAMIIAQEAHVYEMRGTQPPDVLRIMWREAARLEWEAVAALERHIARTGDDGEPTRRILTISAISLQHYPITEDDALAIYAEMRVKDGAE